MVTRHSALGEGYRDIDCAYTWRRSLRQGLRMRVMVTFPVINYFPHGGDSDATITHSMYRDRSDMFHWGRGFPLWENNVPGGLLDSTGLDFPIVGMIGGYRTKPWWYPLATLYWPFEFDYVYGAPVQLSLTQFRKKVTGLVVSQRGVGRDMKRLKSAQSYREIITSQYGTDWVKETLLPVKMEIETPEN